jgi:CheY-like chemotaxis protein
MAPSVLTAGLDSRSLALEASVLRRDGHVVEDCRSGRELLTALATGGVRLVVLGPELPDLALAELVRRIRGDRATRNVSILALMPGGADIDLDGRAVEAGANAVLRRPLEHARLDGWVAKLLAVPRRVRARVPVQGQVVGTPRPASSSHFVGLTRNISVNGILLASPVALPDGSDIEMEISLPTSGALRALGRLVREAPEVGWPYVGYGVEFLFVPDDSMEEITRLVRQGIPPRLPLPSSLRPDLSAIRATVRRETWIYEILAPVEQGGGFQVEIRRAPRDDWRPGLAGPFYVVEAASPEDALAAAREFVRRHG